MLQAVAAGVVLASARAGASEPLRASFLPHWVPQAQFAGYFVAREKGMYRARGIDVRMETGGPDNPASPALQAGKVDFATLWLSSAIQMRDRGHPIVHVAQIVRRSSLLLIARASSGIRTPEDMNGKKVAVWEGDFLLQPQIFFEQHALDVRPVPIASTVNLFLRGGVDVTVAMWYNEYHTILNAGVDPDELATFFFSEHGLDFPEDGIYCLEQTARARPELVEGFVQASLDGWAYAFAHPAEAIDIVLEYMSRAKVATNRVHQEWMLARMRDLVLPKNTARPAAVLAEADYARVASAMRERGWIHGVPPFGQFSREPGR